MSLVSFRSCVTGWKGNHIIGVNMKRIGILTSGGDAPGMNACIRAVVRTAMANNLEISGIKRGYAGLIQGDMFALDRKSITNIIQRGGTILETSRCPEFTTNEGRIKVINVLEEAGIDSLILLHSRLLIVFAIPPCHMNGSSL
jgi:6-phosphofructokinase 1